MATDSPTPQLASLQAIRAVAALMVVLFHLQQHVLPRHLGLSFWNGLSMGYAGVEIFFVLSGFIMMHVHGAEIGSPRAVHRFVLRRIIRILPLYWAVLAAVLTARHLMHGALPQWDAVMRAMLLLPAEAPILRVAWTLSYEMVFYALFALLMLIRSAGLLVGAVLTAIATAGVIAAAVVPMSPMLADHASQGAYGLLFVLGMAAALVWQRLDPPKARALALLGSAALLGIGLGEALAGLHIGKPVRTVLYGLGAAALIAGMVAWDRHTPFRFPAILIRMGDASFALYLIHLPVMSFAAMILVRATPGLSSWAAVMLLTASAAVAALIVHDWVEKPMLAWCKRCFFRSGTPGANRKASVKAVVS